MRARSGSVARLAAAAALAAVLTACSALPSESSHPPTLEAPTTMAVACSSLPPQIPACSDLAASVIALLPKSHDRILAIRIVGAPHFCPPTASCPLVSPTLAAGLTIEGQSHVVGVLVQVLNGGSLVSIDS
jgi:hypothetical protein